ncbi:MAG TPA: helix-turn-helix transcriptional regulator [Prolixibacteraceae bacterium]|nr:helix-turn-helix transcriptional regulator [Prolixibacteraceae bacterium]
MRERIVKFIETEGLTAGEFADKIGVQRSSVSHVLNGRNNPGFSFIQKILDTYPEVNSRWLLTGAGDIYDSDVVSKNEKQEKSVETNDLFSTVNNRNVSNPPLSNKSLQNPVAEQHSQQHVSNEPATNIPKQPKKVVKVLIFYDDHTFEDFRPAE